MPVDTTKVIRGRDLMLFRDVSTTDTPQWQALGAATSHSMQMQADNSDISNKDTAQFKTSLPGGNISWSISAECMYKVGDVADLIEDMTVGNVYKVCFATVKNPSSTGEKPSDGWKPDPNTGYLGDMFLSSFNISAPYEGQATYSAEFTGSGPLKKMTPNQARAYIKALRKSADYIQDESAKKDMKDRANEFEAAQKTK
jgi:TP901-1 family phage major tail protein